MEVSSVNRNAIAGMNVMLLCDVHGAKPAAEVTWFNGSSPVDTKFYSSIPENNVSRYKNFNEREMMFNLYFTYQFGVIFLPRKFKQPKYFSSIDSNYISEMFFHFRKIPSSLLKNNKDFQ